MDSWLNLANNYQIEVLNKGLVTGKFKHFRASIPFFLIQFNSAINE